MEAKVIKHINEKLDSTVATKHYFISPLTEEGGMFMVFTFDTQIIIKFFDTGLIETFLNGDIKKRTVNTMSQYRKFVKDFCADMEKIPYREDFVSELKELID